MEFKMPGTTPIVTKSEHVRPNTVMIIEGVRFADGLNRVVVPVDITDDTVILVEETMRAHQYMLERIEFINRLMSGENPYNGK